MDPTARTMMVAKIDGDGRELIIHVAVSAQVATQLKEAAEEMGLTVEVYAAQLLRLAAQDHAEIAQLTQE